MIKFVRRFRKYQKDEIVNLPEKWEARLIRLGYAEKYEKPKKKKKELEEAPEDKMVKEKDTKKK